MRITVKNERNSGRRVGWTKVVTGVDTTKANGYAFQGDFLQEGRQYDFSDGMVIIEVTPEGSVKNSYQMAACRVVRGDELVQVGEWHDWREEFLNFRDLVAETLKSAQEQPEPEATGECLANVSTEALLEELRRRGVLPVQKEAPPRKPAKPGNVMSRAWEIARASAARFGGSSKAYFQEALRQAWAEKKLSKAA